MLSSRTELLSSRTKKPSWRTELLHQHRTRTEQSNFLAVILSPIVFHNVQHGIWKKVYFKDIV